MKKGQHDTTETNADGYFEKILNQWANDNVPINTMFKNNVAKGLIKYAKDNGLNSHQDVVRLSVAAFLQKAGYL